MAIWLVRAGEHGEFEKKCIEDKRVYITWDNLSIDLRKMKDKEELKNTLAQLYPDNKPKAWINYAGQIWPFVQTMVKTDWVIMPLKTQRTIQIGEITGDYHFEATGPTPCQHWRPVQWIGESIPRDHFGKDLLNSFGAFMTICKIQNNQAESRLQAMYKNGWKAESLSDITKKPAGTAIGAGESTLPVDSDLQELADDGIAQLIKARFSGHALARLVEGILNAQGYTTWRSPEGPDGGVDILAGAGPLGFGSPRLCVEVKSEANPIDRPTVDKLLGALQKFQAQEGLFVSWSGFKSTVQKELAGSFFRVRLWSQKELLAALFAVYDKLDEDLRAELPLKRIWTVAVQDENA